MSRQFEGRSKDRPPSASKRRILVYFRWKIYERKVGRCTTDRRALLVCGPNATRQQQQYRDCYNARSRVLVRLFNPSGCQQCQEKQRRDFTRYSIRQLRPQGNRWPISTTLREFTLLKEVSIPRRPIHTSHTRIAQTASSDLPNPCKNVSVDYTSSRCPIIPCKVDK